MTPALPTPLAVVCHDAGAAQLLLPWIDPTTHAVRALMQGPALDLWRTRFGKVGLVATLEQALDGAALLLSGSGLGADLEHQARVDAAARGLRSAAVIDHWVTYAARFQRDGHRCLPDEIWVCDAEAFALAQASFPGHDIRLQPNSWLRAEVEHLAPSPDPDQRQTILLLPEPLGEPSRRARPGDEQALDFLVANAHRLGLHRPLSLRLRPHADDAPGRWRDWISAQQARHDVTLDTSPTLADALDPVAWVAGLESVALVIALASGRRAVCLQPPWMPRARLPQRGLIHLRDLLPQHASVQPTVGK